MDTVEYSDSLNDQINNKIIVTINAVLPVEKNSTEPEPLSKLISETIFNIANDTTAGNIQTTIKKYAQSILDSYRTPGNDNIAIPQYKNENAPIYKYEIINDVKPIYDNASILCFCRTSEMKKNGKQTILSKYYYSFNRTNNTRISVTDIFNYEDINIINSLLKDKLMRQEQVESQSQLIDMGYFNIENLEVNNNLYFTDKGIVFNYEPFEIACYAIGEVSIELDYEILKPYLKQDFTNNQ